MKKKRIVRMLTMASVMMLLVVFLAVPALCHRWQCFRSH